MVSLNSLTDLAKTRSDISSCHGGIRKAEKHPSCLQSIYCAHAKPHGGDIIFGLNVRKGL